MSEEEKVFLVYAKETSVYGICACGKSFGPYYGEDADKKYLQFMREHECPVTTLSGTVAIQRTGDETV